MAIFDWAAAAKEKRERESFEKLMEQTSLNGDLKEFYDAREYIRDMQHKLEEQEKQLAEYHQFFNTLSRFLPRQSSIHDVLY